MSNDDSPDRLGRNTTKNRKQQKSRATLIVVLGGGLLLLVLCCVGVGIGGYFAVNAVTGNRQLSMANDPEKAIVGKWEYTGDVGKWKTLPGQDPTLEFKGDGSFAIYQRGQKTKEGKWKTRTKGVNTIVVDVPLPVFPPETYTYEVTFIGRDVFHRNMQIDGYQAYKRIE
jgi:hypothetical protein